MVGASEAQIRTLAQRAGYVQIADDKWGNVRLAYDGNPNQGRIRITRNLSKKWAEPGADPSGAHQGEYVDISDGGIQYSAAMEGAPATGNAGQTGWYSEPNHNGRSGNSAMDDDFEFDVPEVGVAP
jgi:hypothetical protein